LIRPRASFQSMFASQGVLPDRGLSPGGPTTPDLAQEPTKVNSSDSRGHLEFCSLRRCFLSVNTYGPPQFRLVTIELHLDLVNQRHTATAVIPFRRDKIAEKVLHPVMDELGINRKGHRGQRTQILRLTAIAETIFRTE
jgi:hypothetical protein